jgi:hypothetical protein
MPRPRFAPRKGPPVLIVQEAGWASEPVWTQSLEEISFASARDQTPVVQSVVRHYADLATRLRLKELPAHKTILVTYCGVCA